jgi:hypothetical protein
MDSDRSALRYRTLQSAADAEKYLASSMESEVVVCIFDFHMICYLEYVMTMHMVDELLPQVPQFASAK